jgi:ferric-dicitrate binding protein FerR (iron transport regulator)
MFEQAVAHIRAGKIEKALPLLIEVLKQNPGDENAWLWMTRCVTEPEQKRYCFEKVLKINPQNQFALRGLRHLNKPVSQPVSQGVSPPTQPKVIEPQPFQRRGFGEAILMFATVGIAIFLVLLCVYAWWVTR